MARKNVTKTDRRRFLTEVGKYGALTLGAAYLPANLSAQGRGGGGGRGGGEGAAGGYESGGDAADDRPEVPVEVKGNQYRMIALTQRRPGLMRVEAFGADSPHIVPAYYATIYAALLGKKPGQCTASVIGTVTDGAFGGDRLPPPGPSNLHITVAHPTTPQTSLVNRDMVVETQWQPLGANGREGGQGWAANMPRWVEPGSEINLIMKQVFAQGTRPNPISGGEKAMYFIKMAPSVAPADQLKAWQALHAKAAPTVRGFSDQIQGMEVLQRVPEVAPKQTIKGYGEVALPDLVAVFWPKEEKLRNFSDYARATRIEDKENIIDLPASFFFLVNEYDGQAR